MLLRVAAESGLDPTHVNHRARLPGDRLKMRGLPLMVEGGVGGVTYTGDVTRQRVRAIRELIQTMTARPA